MPIGQAPEGFGQRHLFLVLRFGSRTALFSGACFAAGFVNGEERELAAIVDCSAQLRNFGGHGGRAGGAQAVDLFAVMQRLRREDLALRLELMSAILGAG